MTRDEHKNIKHIHRKIFLYLYFIMRYGYMVIINSEKRNSPIVFIT